jgi:hypothetical protein
MFEMNDEALENKKEIVQARKQMGYPLPKKE